jgi:hypothetical protein
MNFHGAAERLKPEDISAAAESFGVEVAAFGLC